MLIAFMYIYACVFTACPQLKSQQWAEQNHDTGLHQLLGRGITVSYLM